MRKFIYFFISGIIIFYLGFFLSFKFYTYEKNRKIILNLENKLISYVKVFEGDCAFLVKILKKPYTEISYKKDEVFAAASVIKLPIAIVVFKAIDERKISYYNKVVIKKKDLVGGSGIIKAKKLPLRLSIEELIELMLAYSDNTATNKLIEILGFEYINKSFKELGLKNTILNRKMMDFSKRKKGFENYTNVSDIAYVLEKIYKKELLKHDYCEKLLYCLKKQNIKDRIPRDLPQNIIVGHKTGLEKNVVHDVGIVFLKNVDYIICVFTKNMKNYKKAKDFIAKLSFLTYSILDSYL